MAGRSDPAQRKRAQRSSREKRCWVYVPAERLVAAGIDPDDPTPYYRVWGGRRGSLLVTLYRQP